MDSMRERISQVESAGAIEGQARGAAGIALLLRAPEICVDQTQMMKPISLAEAPLPSCPLYSTFAI